MSAHHAPDVDLIGHEETDAEIGPLIRFAIFLTAITVAIAALTVGFYKFLDSREAAEKAPRYPMAVGVERPLPPPPRLQTYPFDDVKVLGPDGFDQPVELTRERAAELAAAV